MHAVRPEPEDKENEAVGRAFSHATAKAAATTLPTLYLEGLREPLFLDFGQVPVGSSKAVTFAIAGKRAGGRGEVDRAPKGVHVSLGETAGVVEWGPTTLGPIREVLLLRFNKRHRLQVTLLGHGVARGAVTMVSTAGKAAPSTTIRQPLHSTFHNNQRQQPQEGHTQQDIRKKFAVNTSISCAPRRLDLGGGHDENDNDHGCNPPSSSASSRRDSFLSPDLDDVTASARPPRQSLSAPSSPVQQRGRARQRAEQFASLAFRATSAGLLSEGRHRGGSTSSTIHKSSTTAPTSTHPSKERPPVQAFRQENILVEWLNFALCPPDAAQSNLRPGDFLKRQDDEIKAQVQAIYDSAEMGVVEHTIKLEIGRKWLQVRDDRDLHMDLSLREAFLELLLSYQLPWLQVGLEVLLDTEIATARLVKARDGQLIRVPALSVVRKLIVTQILSDPTIAKAYAGRPSPKAREAMKVELRAHTMERFLSLVVLLDQAKRMEILPRRRPLFKPTAGIKSSAAMLHSFAKDYMAGEGNLARHLLRLGYGVEIQQQYLEEFDFRTTALSRDLRDGVRLVRLVEVLTAADGKDGDAPPLPLSSSLRVPAISRLQKVHNVKIALEALRACGLQQDQAPPQRKQHLAGRLGSTLVLGRLCPDDIVDGHREKTLGLLWAIVRHYQLDYVVSSLTGITSMQSLVRARLTRRRFLCLKHLALSLQRLYRARRVLFRCHTFSPAGAIALQSAWRGICERRRLLDLRASVLTLQAGARGFLIRRRRARLWSVVRLLQVYVRAHLTRRRQALERLAAAVTLIASAWKGYCVRVEMRQRQGKAVIIQSAYRRCRNQRSYLKLRRATVYAQALVRRGRARRQLGEQQEAARTLERQQISAATLLASTWKGYCVRVEMRQRQGKAVVIQAVYRRCHVQRAFWELRRATVYAQALARGAIMRRQLAQQQRAADTLKRHWRARQAHKAFRAQVGAVVLLRRLLRGYWARREYQQQRSALLVLQGAFRGHLLRKQLLIEKEAAIVVQTFWRARREQRRWREICLGVVALQALARGKASRRVARGRAEAILMIQKSYRGFSSREALRRRKNSVQQIQAAWRGHQARCRWALAVRGIVRCQTLVRGLKARQEARRRWHSLLLLQRAVRRFFYESPGEKVAASVHVQRMWRGYALRKELAIWAHAATRLQAAYRGICVRRAQRRVVSAARCLQGWARAGRARRRMRRFHRAVLLAQAVVRGWLVRRVSLPKVRVLRVRVREATARAEADPSLRIGVRHAAALEVLLSGKSCAQLLRSCLTLVVSTSLARECCEALVEVEGVPKLLAVIRSCNRSTPHMGLLRLVLRVLSYVTAHPSLLPALAEAEGAVETFVELLQTYRPDDHTFLPAGKLLLSACESECAVQARVDLHHPNVQRRLQGSLRLLERKAEVEKKSNSRTMTTRVPKAGGKEVGLAGPIRVLRSILSVTAAGNG